ncbi:MAG: DUF4326 domain-containing protein [Crinalium sp.]
MTINILNGYQSGWDKGHYIGRAGKGRKGSALANPFKLVNAEDSAQRAWVIQRYREWLWQQIQASNPVVINELLLLKKQAEEGDLNLLCFCAPRPCHGNVIKSCVEWLILSDNSSAGDVRN